MAMAKVDMNSTVKTIVSKRFKAKLLKVEAMFRGLLFTPLDVKVETLKVEF